MMRKAWLFAFLFAIGMVHAQIPDGYYDDAQGLTGYALKTALSEITGQGYNQRSYAALWGFFAQYDLDSYYEDDGTILDIYSENPDGPDPYDYQPVSDQCGNYAEEGDCYNREHLMPKSWFDGAYPMKTDIHHIYPTDGYVNNRHSNLPFGEVDNPTYVSENGSKKGPNAYDYPGAYTGPVFEPIDEFKGDIARTYFYMATRYEDQVAGWEYANNGSEQTFNGTSDQVFTDWTLNMLLEWNEEDPVSQREIDRNNAAYEFQGNRNPFIDHPEYVEMIWGTPDGGGDSDNDAIYFEDFNDCASVADNFVSISELSAQDWHCITDHGQNNTGAMQMNGFSEGQQVPSIDWLITTNPINFDAYTDEKLSFYTEATFGNTPLQLLYSSDYDGSGVPSDYTWQPVPNLSIPDYPQGESDPVQTLFSDIDLSPLTGTAVYLAFKYDNTNGEAATRWTVDSFKITGETTMGVSGGKAQRFKLYPNPVRNGYFVMRSPGHSSFTYRIFNLTGQMIKKGKTEQAKTEVDTKGWPGGLYLIKMTTGHQTVTKRLLVD